MAYKSSNSPHFLKAAYLNNVPTYELLGDSIQYGQGKRSRWLNSSFTQETSQLSTNFARNKHHSAHLMRRAGIPVPEHHLASNENSATLIANKLGYPVVIKPADADGGFGVTAELMSDDEIGQAFKLASKYSKKVLVEKHVYGKDYRLIAVSYTHLTLPTNREV